MIGMTCLARPKLNEACAARAWEWDGGRFGMPLRQDTEISFRCAPSRLESVLRLRPQNQVLQDQPALLSADFIDLVPEFRAVY